MVFKTAWFYTANSTNTYREVFIDSRGFFHSFACRWRRVRWISRGIRGQENNNHTISRDFSNYYVADLAWHMDDNWVWDNLDMWKKTQWSGPECIPEFCLLYLLFIIFMTSLITQFYLFTSQLYTFLSSSMENFLHILSALRGYENGCKYLTSLIRRGEKCAECDIESLGAWLQLFLTCSTVHCKKKLAVFPSPAGMSLTKLSLPGK